MFRGTIHQINHPSSPSSPDGLALKRDAYGRPNERVYEPLSVKWINHLFSEAYWSEPDHDLSPGIHFGNAFGARRASADDDWR